MSPSSQIFPPAAMETHTLTLAGPEPSSVSLHYTIIYTLQMLQS